MLTYETFALSKGGGCRIFSIQGRTWKWGLLDFHDSGGGVEKGEDNYSGGWDPRGSFDTISKFIQFSACKLK